MIGDNYSCRSAAVVDVDHDLQALAGRRAVEQLDAVLGFAQAARALSFEQRRALGLVLHHGVGPVVAFEQAHSLAFRANASA